MSLGDAAAVVIAGAALYLAYKFSSSSPSSPAPAPSGYPAAAQPATNLSAPTPVYVQQTPPQIVYVQVPVATQSQPQQTYDWLPPAEMGITSMPSGVASAETTSSPDWLGCA